MLRYLLSPWWAAQLLTGAKSFMDNPLLGSRRLNEWGLHTWRLGLADRMARTRRRRLAHLLSPADRADFDRDGFVVKRGFLPEADFAALLAQVQAYRGAAREQVQGNTVTRRFACNLDTRRRIPALHALQQLPACGAA